MVEGGRDNESTLSDLMTELFGYEIGIYDHLLLLDEDG